MNKDAIKKKVFDIIENNFFDKDYFFVDFDDPEIQRILDKIVNVIEEAKYE